MTFRLVLMICSMLSGQPECRYEEQPQLYWSLKECAEAGQMARGAKAWKCQFRAEEHAQACGFVVNSCRRKA